METQVESLIVVNTSEGLQEVSRQWTLVQTHPPRLAIVRAGAEELRTGAAGTVAVLNPSSVDEVEAALQSPLSESERLFVEAWLLRRRPKENRKGDGLPWDAPGFTPPDR